MITNLSRAGHWLAWPVVRTGWWTPEPQGSGDHGSETLSERLNDLTDHWVEDSLGSPKLCKQTQSGPGCVVETSIPPP